MNGIINVLKPSEMTSHDVVSFIRRTLNIKKVGHTGTLDPNAAGVLPICIGKATRISQYFNSFKKGYRAELTFGFETDTQDKYGNIINESKSHNVNSYEIENALKHFEGSQKQIPPMYSAIRHNGQRLYELARKGKVVERMARKVEIYNNKLIKNYDNKKILFDIECSSGTYIRTLCNDIGRYIGTYGCMTFLLRTQVGDFRIEDSHTLEEIVELSNLNHIENIILPIDYPLKHLKKISLNNRFYKTLRNGGQVSLKDISMELFTINELIRVYCDELFIGLGNLYEENDEIILRMEKVFV